MYPVRESYDPKAVARPALFLALRQHTLGEMGIQERALARQGGDAACLVYAAVNMTSGALYVGMTTEGMARRARRHFGQAESGALDTRFARAIRKYGRGGFEFIVLRRCKDVSDARQWERWMIEDFRPEYNLTLGGEGVHGLVMSAEARAKMSAAKKGRPAAWLSGLNAAAIKEKLRGPKTWVRKPLTNEHKAKLTAGAVLSRSKAVLCENDGRTFRNCAHAAVAYGLSSSMVGLIAAGKSRSRRGLRFTFMGEARH
jgi:group I intron endonuclease